MPEVHALVNFYLYHSVQDAREMFEADPAANQEVSLAGNQNMVRNKTSNDGEVIII